MADALVPPRRDLPIVEADGRPTLRFAQYLERVGRDITSTTIEETQIISNASEIAQQGALIKGLRDRIDDLESTNDQDILNSKIAWLAANMNTLINDLIEAVNALNSQAIDQESLEKQEQSLAQLRLLNERVQEAFETSIEIEDIEDGDS